MNLKTIIHNTALMLFFALASVLVQAQTRRVLPVEGLRYYNSGELRTNVKFYPLGDYNVKGYYQNGVLRSDETWHDSVRNGLCKYFGSDGTLVKEITFARNFLIDYKSYLNGRLYCQINKERTIVFNKGVRLNLDFDKYYEVDPSGYVMVFTRKKLIDALLLFGNPEEVTELMKVKFDEFSFNNPVTQGKDVLNCGGRQSRLNDGGVDLQSFNDAARSQAGNTSGSASTGSIPQNASSAMVGALLNSFGTKCGGSLPGGMSPGSASLKPKYTSQQETARQAAQKMISNCNSVSDTERKNAMIGADAVTETISDYAIVTDFVGMAVGLAAEYAKTQGGSMAIVEAGITAGKYAVPAFAAIGTFTTAYSFTTFVRSKIDAEPIQNMLTPLTQSELEKEQTKLAAEKQAQKNASSQAIGTTGASAANTGPATSQQPGAAQNSGAKQPASPAVTGAQVDPSRPVTDDGQGDPCKAMQNFYDRCERSGWQEYSCSEFVRFANGCFGDIRTMMPSPEGGDVNAIGCGAKFDSETARRLECKRKGMFAYVTPGNLNGVCNQQNIGMDISALQNFVFDPRYTDPPENPLFLNFLKETKVNFFSKASFEEKLNSGAKQLVVFIGLNCTASFEYSKKMFSQAKEMGLEVSVVDATQQPELVSQYKVSVVPTTFVMTSKKLGNRKEGNMQSSDIKAYFKAVSQLK